MGERGILVDTNGGELEESVVVVRGTATRIKSAGVVREHRGGKVVIHLSTY